MGKKWQRGQSLTSSKSEYGSKTHTSEIVTLIFCRYESRFLKLPRRCIFHRRSERFYFLIGGSAKSLSEITECSDHLTWGPFDSDDSEESDLDEVAPAELPCMDPPSELLMPLLPFQKQFLYWAMQQVTLLGSPKF